MDQTGRVTISYDGNQLRSKQGASIQIGGAVREVGITDQGVAYNKETLIPAVIKCTMVHCSDTDLKALRAFRGGTVTYTTDTGVTYTVANAVTTATGDLANGEVEVTFSGSPAK